MEDYLGICMWIQYDYKDHYKWERDSQELDSEEEMWQQRQKYQRRATFLAFRIDKGGHDPRNRSGL